MSIGNMSLIPDIPVKYETFPDNYINDVNGWAFDRETIENNIRKLLTLDLDFGDKCSLNCPFCFRKDNSVDILNRQLSYNDLVNIVLEAKKLGLRSVKLLGAGEPLENPRILEFIKKLHELDVITVLFTKTGIIGDDDAVTDHFSDYGIFTGEELAAELNKNSVSMVVGLNSFDPNIQSAMVGNGINYIEKRNRTIEILVNEGFNSSNPTKLAIGISPITSSNINEAYNIYKWARVRNFYAIVTPTMISGRAKDDAWRSLTPNPIKLISLYEDIYRFNIETGLSSLDELAVDGIASYAGGHPCNQVSTGLYITLNGVVLSCPGSEELIEGNIWESSLSDIWNNSENIKRESTFNCRCIAKDGKSISTNLYDEVMMAISD